MMFEKTKAKVAQVEAIWKKHAIRNALLTLGRRKGPRGPDNLIHALVPLFFTRGEAVQITGGDASRFWAAHGVKVSPQVIAKMLREHVGYARRTRAGIEITPNGVKYVEAALAQ